MTLNLDAQLCLIMYHTTNLRLTVGVQQVGQIQQVVVQRQYIFIQM